jgi:hypothetical protein
VQRQNAPKTAHKKRTPARTPSKTTAPSKELLTPTTEMTRPHFIILTDRATLKAGWIADPDTTHTPQFMRDFSARPPKIAWTDQLSFVKARQHVVEQQSDMAGAFAPTGGSGAAGSRPTQLGGSPPDKHLNVTATREAVELIASTIHKILMQQKPELWSLSAPTDIHKKLVQALPEVCRAHLHRVIPKNLSECPEETVLDHFLHPV